MEPNRWQEVKAIVGDALELEEPQRRDFVESACGEDAELREQVESLLEASKGDTLVLDHSALGEALHLVAAAEDQEGRIGPFEVIRELGQGGMGTVYLARRMDGELRVPVALKIVRRSLTASDVLERFRLEREVLAGLSHPYIAKVFDGGSTDDGVPYFAMEYVEGTRIDRYCDDHRLEVDERIALFSKVCEAVHYAHQHLIVHRDLKPGNILVTSAGTPKLLDFGIAKLLDEESGVGDPTLNAMQALTPDYASPEQILGGSVTTASDVYSLGVLLYELLTGHKPLEIKGRALSDAVDTLRDEEPERPSTAVDRNAVEDPDDDTVQTAEQVADHRKTTPVELRRRLAGDLGNVVLKALCKEPSERYFSVRAFAEDLKREREGRPVAAQPDTLGYRFRTFLRRHKLGVAAAALVFVTLVGGIAGTAWQSRVAQRERDLAERRFDEIRGLANTVMFEIHDAIEPLAGSTAARELLVARAIEYLDRLAQEVGDDPALLAELATGYERIGEVQGAVFRSNLGQPEEARESFEKSLDLRRRRLELEPENPQASVDMATSLAWMGEHEFGWAGETSRALEYYEEARTILGQIPEAEMDREALLSSLKLNGRTTWCLVTVGMPQQAVAVQRHSLTINEQLRKRGLEEVQVLKNSAHLLIQLGVALAEAGETEAAVRRASEAVEAADRAAELTTDAEVEMLRAVSRRELGSFLVAAGQLIEAPAILRQATAMLEEMVEAEPGNTQNLENFGVALDRLALALVVTGEPEAGLEIYRRLLSMIDAYLAEVGASAEVEGGRVGVTQRIGDALVALGESVPAIDSYRQSIETGEELVSAYPGNAMTRRDLAVAYLKQAALLATMGACDQAEEARSRGHDLWSEVEALGIRTADLYQDPTPLLRALSCNP